MAIALDTLPTPLALVASRLKIVGSEQSTDTFMATSYVFEAAIKILGICLQAGLEDSARDHAYRFAYDLVRADGLGIWPSTIEKMTSMPIASFLPTEYTPLVDWFTKRRTKVEDEWCRIALSDTREILGELGLEAVKSSRDNVRQLVSLLVQIRNKTKAHGALGPDFYNTNNVRYIASVNALLLHCPIFDWPWYHLSHRAGNDPVRGVRLLGPSPSYIKKADATQLIAKEEGVYVEAPSTGRLFFLGTLLGSTRECREFVMPNGNIRDADASGEVIDYAIGATRRRDFANLSNTPAPLPPSETAGLALVDVQSNVFGNLPPLPPDYVARPALESELLTILLDHNHCIVTLHGNGGMGKTYLALAVAHRLSEASPSRFGDIVWFSARDLDLRLSGARAVKPQVVTLGDVCCQYAKLYVDTKPTTEAFATILQGSNERSRPGVLFVFDNFETMQDLRELHKFLDQHTSAPNKVLLTSRERAFKADYPIEVLGMERAESEVMLRRFARDLRAEQLLTEKVMDSVYEQTKGHPYVMKVLVGEMAKEKRYLAPLQILSSRVDVAQAVFERSFTKLSESARSIFLTITNWKSYISELSLLVVLGVRGVDVESGLDECLRLSLIYVQDRTDGDRLYFAPELARSYGKKKLDGDPDRLVIQADLEILRRFGVTADPTREGIQTTLVTKFIGWCKEEARTGASDRIRQIDGLLETLANLWPSAWIDLGIFRRHTGATVDSIELAFRRAVEEAPSAQAWLERAEYAKYTGSERTWISSLVSAVDAKPDDVALLKEVAFQLTKYVRDKVVPLATRTVFLSSIREHMQRLESQLDAVGLSRLAWLYILEGDTSRGRACAESGLRLEPDNNYCQNLIEHLDRPQ